MAGILSTDNQILDLGGWATLSTPLSHIVGTSLSV